MVLIYKLAFSETYLQLADMPGTWHIGLTAPDKRPWFIHPLGIENALPTWIVFATIIPAILVSILLFAEIEIIE
jgi:HCO3- transporter family